MRCPVIIGCFLCGLLLGSVVPGNLLGGTAHAEPNETVLRVHGGELVEHTVSGKRLRTVATIPANLGVVSRIENATSGQVHMLVGPDRVLHVVRGTKGPTSTLVECHGEATLSGDGRCIGCARGVRGIEIHRFGAKIPMRTIPVPARRIAFGGGGDGTKLVAIRGKALWSFHGAKATSKLAPHAPDGPWLVAPDGVRAAGVYGTGSKRQLMTFKLDGTAIKRRLLRDAQPVAWSRDSQWLLVQSGNAACIVRGIGGQYKCWKGFRAIDIASDGAYALLGHTPRDAKQPALYVGELAGARPRPPKLILTPLEAAAAWRPAPSVKPAKPALRRSAP